VVNGGPISAVSNTAAPAPAPAARGPVGFTPRVAAGGGYAPAAAPMRPAQGYAAPAMPAQPAQPAPVEMVQPVEIQAPEPAPQLRAPAATRQHTPVAPQQNTGWSSIFRKATGLMQRDLPDQPAPQPVQTRSEPAAPAAPVRATPQEEMGLEIPTFLRRQTN